MQILDDIFEGNEEPKDEIYKAAQQVVKSYMDKTNKKIDYVARELGTTQGYLRKQLDPNQPERPLSVDRVVDITRLTGDNGIIAEIAKELDLMIVPKLNTEAGAIDINSLVDVANIQNADVFKVVKLALLDDELNSDELDQILKELDEADSANAMLRNRAEAIRKNRIKE